MIDTDYGLSLSRQAELLALSRTSLYHQPVPVTAADLALMRRIDELHLELPFACSRLLRDLLRGEGHAVSRKRVRRLTRRMGIIAIYRRANTSCRHPRHPVFPCLLRGIAIERPKQVWPDDITFIPVARGFVYLVAVNDVYSRRILAWLIYNRSSP